MKSMETIFFVISIPENFSVHIGVIFLHKLLLFSFLFNFIRLIFLSLGRPQIDRGLVIHCVCESKRLESYLCFSFQFILFSCLFSVNLIRNFIWVCFCETSCKFYL